MKNQKHPIRPHKSLARLGIILMAATAGCATTGISEELHTARSAYDDAENSKAPVNAPNALYEARKALDRAERAAEDDPQSVDERRLAYIATRKAEYAQIQAAFVDAQRGVEQAQARFEQVRHSATKAQLAAAERNLDAARAKLENEEERAEHLASELEQERVARERAEETAAEALDALEAHAKVETMGEKTKISLSGSVLFTSGEATLMPSARNVLNGLADAVKSQSQETTIVVEGHTDSIGTDAFNRDLSRRRAEAVRDFLVDNGVHPDRIRAVGVGEEQPVATNATPEGRANNRRVEVILSPHRYSSR